jgi:hypothetical protein
MAAGRAMTIVPPGGGPAGLAAGGGGADGLGGTGGIAGLAAAAGFGGAEGAAGTIAAFGVARICFTCSISLPESNGLGMWPFAPTAMALVGSMGVPPPSRRTGTSLRAASARTRWQSS